MPKKRATRGRRATLNKKATVAAAAKETGDVEEKVSGNEDEKNEIGASLNAEIDSRQPQSRNVNVVNQSDETEDDKNSKLKEYSDCGGVGKNVVSTDENQDEDEPSNVNINDSSTSRNHPTKAQDTKASAKNIAKNIVSEKKDEDNLFEKNKNADADFADEAEEAFIDNESDEDVQYIDEEIIEEKDQELCEVLEGQQEENFVTTAKDMDNVHEKDNTDQVVEENEKNTTEDNNFELISEGSMDQLGQSEIVEAISDSEIILDETDQDKRKDCYNNEAAETLEQVFLATENDNIDKVLVEDKDNDYISDVSLCGDDDNGNLSLEEISDEELEASKKKHPLRSDSIQLDKSDAKEKVQEEDKDSGTVEIVDVGNKKRKHIKNDEDKNGIPLKKVKLGSDHSKDDSKQDNYGDAAFFTNISVSGKSKEGSKPPSHNPPSKKYMQQSAISKDFSTACQIDISTQTLPLSKKGKIVQCNIRLISEEANMMTEKGKRESMCISKLNDEYKSQLPSSISEVFQKITSTTLSEQGYYQFSLGPVTHADIDNTEFREISMKFVEQFQLSFNSKHQGIFTAQLQRQEAVAHLIRRLKRLELGTRYMVFSIAYRHGPLASEDSLWTASIVFMYSQDRQGERQKFISDGKERARLSVEGVPKAVSKDFIQMLFPESLYISSRLGTSLDKSLVLGYSSYLVVEETCACCEMVLINGKKIAMSPMDPVKETTNTTQTDPGYIDENGIVLIPDTEVNMIEESILPSTETDKTTTPIEPEKGITAQESPGDDGLPESESAKQNSSENSGKNVTPELVLEVIKESEEVSCSRNETEPDNAVVALQDKEEKESTTKDSDCHRNTEKEDSTGEKHLAEKESSEDLPNAAEVALSENIEDADALSLHRASSEDTSKNKQEHGKESSSGTHDQSGIEAKTKELSSNSGNAVETEVIKEGLQAKESDDISMSAGGEEYVQSNVVNDMEKRPAVEGENVEMEKVAENESSSKIEKDDMTVENEKCEKDTSLEDVSDDEIINNDSKAVDSTTDDDVIILQEDPCKRVVAEIDLTEDMDEPTHASGLDTKENKEKKKSEVNEKLSLTDGDFQVTLEAINVEEEDEPERIIYPSFDYSKYKRDQYQEDKHRGTGPADSDVWQPGQYIRPGVRFVTRSGEVYVPKANTKEWSPRYEYYNSESHKSYEQVSSVRSGSSVGDVSGTYEGSGLTRPPKSKPSIREKSLEHYENYKREYRRSESPSPRRDQGFERKAAQLPQRSSDHFLHSRQVYSKDFSHGYSYGSASNSKQGRVYSDWQSELSDAKRRDAYQAYEGHKSWNDGYSRRKSPDHLPSSAYDIKKCAATTTSSANSRVSNDRRSPNRFRQTRSRSLSPLSDKSFSSSSQSSRNKRGRANRSKASYKRISHSPISISSRSQSLSPVSKSPTPQRYSRSSLYKSRRDQHSPIDRKTSHMYTSKHRSRSRSPYWSKTKTRSRSPSFEKDECSLPYKRAALSPVTNRDKPRTSSSTKPSHATWQSQGEKNRTMSYEPAGGQAKTKTVDIKSAPHGNYQQQGPPQGYGYHVAPVNYNTPPPFAHWPATSFPPPTCYTPQQMPVYTNNNPTVAAQYTYSGMPDYTNMNTYPSYSYNMSAPANNPNQVPQPNYNPYATSTPQGISQSGTASSMMGVSSAKKPTQSSKPESSKKWSMGQGGGALVFQRILSSVSKSKK